jgi:hypothetical protein
MQTMYDNANPISMDMVYLSGRNAAATSKMKSESLLKDMAALLRYCIAILSRFSRLLKCIHKG